MSNPAWIDAMSAESLPDDDVIGIAVAGRDVAIYTVGDDVFATDILCTHGNARLCDGFLDGHEIECPLHQALFHIPTGEVRSAPATEPLRVFPVRVVGDAIEVQARDA